MHSRSFSASGSGRTPSRGASNARKPFSSSRPYSGGSSFGGRGGSAPRRFGGASRGGRGRYVHKGIDVSHFINKAVITEVVEHFVPEHKFADFDVVPGLKQAVLKRGYENPTPIQDRAIPHILKGLDLVGIADTGTGKTAAFLIPLINKVLKNPKERVLIMAPTRELAQQIEEELRLFTPGMRIYSACCVGGASIGMQISALRRNPSFVIGTPGRLKDLMERKALDVSHFGTVVLDEADRMLDMGFIADMRYILSLLSKPRHTLFFSATLSSEIERLIGEFLMEPVRISVKTGDTSKDVEQDVVKIPAGKHKIEVLHDLLIDPTFSKVLVFGQTKHGVEKLSKALIERGFKSESIHGNKTQAKRQKALKAFKDGYVQILTATDVAARGLDISGVTHVINYDLPSSREDYVHRIGRTGRAGKKGKALTFIEEK